MNTPRLPRLDHQVAIKEYLPADTAGRAVDGETVLARPGAEAAFEAGLARLINSHYDEAVAEIETAITLNPNFAQAYQTMAWALNAVGTPEDAIEFCDKGIKLSPHDPYMSGFLTVRAWAHLALGQYEDAARWASKAARLPHAVFWARACQISALGHLGRAKEAQASLDELLQQNPNFSLWLVEDGLYYWKAREQIDLFLDGLKKAGLPE